MKGVTVGDKTRNNAKDILVDIVQNAGRADGYDDRKTYVKIVMRNKVDMDDAMMRDKRALLDELATSIVPDQLNIKSGGSVASKYIIVVEMYGTMDGAGSIVDAIRLFMGKAGVHDTDLAIEIRAIDRK